MEALEATESSSVYMCFPCYQEFNTLEEVLQHQLTCTAEDEQQETSATIPVTVPLLQNQQQVINISGAVAVPQIQPVLKQRVLSAEAADQPRILYQCGDCDELFKSLDLWQQHRGFLSQEERSEQKAQTEPVLLCVDCGSCFGLVSELVSHRKTQHGFEEALHRCSVCGESFLNTTLFLYHRKQHRQKGEETVVGEEVCPQGNGTEEQDPDVAASMETEPSHYTQPELFMCTQCGESFNGEGGLGTHRKQKHDLKEPLHSCPHCEESFMNTTQFLYHRRQHRFTSGTEEVVDGVERSEETVEAAAQAAAQNSKRLLSPPASASESGSPLFKRSRPSFRILSGSSPLKGLKGIKEESEVGTAADSDHTNHPPPAKLLQDWARTPLPHVCPYCGKTFTRRVFLRTHVYSHTGEKLFTCKVCTKSFTNSQSLLRHSMSHTGNKPYSCDVCGKNFSQAATLKRHQRIHTSTLPRRKRGRKPACTLDNEGAAHLFPCPNCPSRFNTEDQLNHHKEHLAGRRDCSTPAIRFLAKNVERLSNAGETLTCTRSRTKVECDLCGHRCMTQEGLDLHRLSHTGQTPLRCPVRPCRRRFTSDSTLEEHVLAHFQGTLGKSKNRPRYRCQICHKDFAYTSTFNVHMRTHTDERPFECATCGKRFRQLPHLQDHERIHSGLRPFCCWICGKSFSVAARLTEHARTHSGEKPYPCPHCPAAFRSRSNLDKHIRLHGDLPLESAEEAAQAAEAAHVQKVLEGAKVLSSLASTGDLDSGSVQTIYVLQGDGGTETVMIPSDQFGNIDSTSQVVILPSSVLGGQGINVPTITMDGNEITMVETSQSEQHAIEFIVEETV
ncbi:Zinc finger protein 574 [Dissostichus eleginoides]|uniref:Zinc finger protein 574 n=1 Tax=Dissostichus eleginoides TaxID=100907 RepID=A0AAD9C697_DISEL|nr:Zinc finger protein 574 [Dissostichus eleginoides]